MDAAKLKPVLDRLYSSFDFEGSVLRDPIEFPRSYDKAADREVAGIISSSFAYGSVKLFRAVLKQLFSRMGGSPYEFILNFDPAKDGVLFKGIKYRFNENADIVAFFHILGVTLRGHGSVQQAFKSHYSDDDPDIGRGLAGLLETMLMTDTTAVYGRNARPAGLLQLMPSPAKGSACKRMNLFLRWMIRDRDIDFGIWQGIPKNRLVIPLDTHIARIAKCLGLTGRASANWKMAVEITKSLRALDPDDPLRYDFALCHQGISGLCSAKKCADCRLFGKALP